MHTPDPSWKNGPKSETYPVALCHCIECGETFETEDVTEYPDPWGVSYSPESDYCSVCSGDIEYEIEWRET